MYYPSASDYFAESIQHEIRNFNWYRGKEECQLSMKSFGLNGLNIGLKRSRIFPVRNL